ncbi:MAG: methyltransferase domain-containing protein [Candidatus Micrarchaeota archaeon]
MAEKDQVKIYSGLARNYDIDEKLLLLAGLRLGHYRRLAAGELRLRPGATVIDLGCGTGLNFPMLEQAVGPRGRIIGVDITKAMLGEAEKRVRRNGWKNVELVRSDMAGYEFPEADGILSTCAITLVPEYDDVIRKGSQALKPGGRFVILDFKKPEWPGWLVGLAARLLVEPFGGDIGMASRHPWESLGRHLRLKAFREFYFGGMYIATGEKPRTGRRNQPRKKSHSRHQSE